MSAIERVFLEWSQPALPSAARWLLERAPAQGDLSGFVVVIPGSRAGRRLLEILVQQCAAANIGLSPPKIVTIGALPELLYPPQRPFADELTQRLAWVEALRKVARDRQARDEIQHFIPALPSQRDTTRLLELADVLRGQHTELAADGLDFADVARHTAELGNESEAQRWQALQKIQRAYLDTLDRLQLWDKQTARLEAIKRRESHADKRIVLVGTVDMNRTARQMLDQVARQVTALVVAPRELESSFDAHGCVAPAAWADARLPVDDARVVIADDPIDQADEVARAIAAWCGSGDRLESKSSTGGSGAPPHGPPKYRGDQITIGVCDERVVPQIARQLDQCQLRSRWGPGRAIGETPPFRLLQAAADYLERQSWRDFAALVRHVDVEAWLNRQPAIAALAAKDWLTALDSYQSAHVQTRLSGQWLGEDDERTQDQVAAVKAVYEAIAHLLAELDDDKLPLADWPPRVSRLLLQVYSGREFDRQNAADRTALAALEALHEALLDQRNIPENLAPRIAAAESIRWALDAVAGMTLPPPPDAAAIELLGWLELPLDDAPALVVATFNEGLVPKSSTGDMFLPDSLRTRLGLDDNARRYARDAYALSVLLASRDAWLIVGRRDADGYPLAPSRLLLGCEDDALIRRAQTFFTPPPARAAKRPLAGSLAATRQEAAFDVPRPQPLKEPIEKLRVTAFRDYLACPYRFYLKHVVRIEGCDDAADELDGGAFGGLAHAVLNRFGRDERRHTENTEEIETLLLESLSQLVCEIFGENPRAAVAVQVEQLRRRLQTLARVQAERAAAGWRIVYTEVPADETVCVIDVDGQPFTLTGRIDRIDFHESSGAWAIWDYKTSDTPRKPAATHRRKEDWIDLQLPLYRHLAAEVDGDLKSILEDDGMLQLGYIQLPKSTDGVKFEPAEWTAAELQSAVDCAHRVVRGLREQKFWPPAEPPPDFSEDLAGICLDNVFGRPPFVEMENTIQMDK